MTTGSLPRIAVLLSGRGSNFEAIARNVLGGHLACELALVFSNKPGASGIKLAEDFGLPVATIPSKGKDRAEFDREVLGLLREHKIDLVCLAGYMRLLTAEFVQSFPNRILNIHPALLPAFPGLDAQAQALRHGVKVTGCTVHFVDEGLDSGPIIMQAAVPVEDTDTVETLALRILREEHRVYSEAIAFVLEGNFEVKDRRVIKK